MSREYITVDDQNMYDVCVQKFAGLDDLDQVMRNVPNLNKILPFGLSITLPDTEDTLARFFDSNRTFFVTGQPEEVPFGSYGDSYNKDYN